MKPAQPGWIARRFGLGRQRSRRPPFPSRGNAPFTPETCPGLTLEDCAILNTPVEECDPEILRLLLSALAQHIVATLPAELGMTDAQAVFATLWGRLGCDSRPAPEQPAAAPPPPPSAEAEAIPAPDSVAVACERTPDRVPSNAGFRRARPLPGGRGRRVSRALLRRRVQQPPMRRLCYAACAGPP